MGPKNTLDSDTSNLYLTFSPIRVVLELREFLGRKNVIATGVVSAHQPAKGEQTTPHNRKRHYDTIILTLFMVFHNSKFSAYARGLGGDTARLCVRFL